MSELLGAAAGSALPVVRAITDDQLGDPTPCPEYDVRELADHLFQVVTNFRELAAKREADFGAAPRRVEPGGDWRERFAAETAALAAAWAAPGAEEGTAGSLGLPARTVGFMALGDLTVHAWDLARATGRSYAPERFVIAELAPAVAAMAPMAREYGVYGAAAEPGEEASDFERMLAMTGRDPHWEPPAR